MKYEIDNFAIDNHFSSSVYRVHKPEFLDIVRPVFNDFLEISKREQDPNPVYPGIMTGLISEDERATPFVQYVSNISWDVLDRQGYDMSNFYTNAMEMWGQHHPYRSSMENHIHGSSTQLVGFYFLDTPSESSSLSIHDPRAVKVYASLPVKESNKCLSSYNIITYSPEPGDLIFTNSWLAHSFTRNVSQTPYNFIHINVSVVSRGDVQTQAKPIII
jgi:hypothetical protein